MHFSFESLVVISIPSLQTSLMDMHHDTSFRCILKDDFIFSAFKIYIHFCSDKEVELWLVARPSICSFHIAHFIFILALCFCLGLIQPLTFKLITCECGHRLDASGMHLIRCPFKVQLIVTHDAIWNVMYGLVRKCDHIIQKKRWYSFIFRVSSYADLYMMHS
jgi:hypothetical protein